MNHIFICRIAAAFGCLALIPIASATQLYTYQDIGPVGGSAWPFAINNSGLITAQNNSDIGAGYSYTWNAGAITYMPLSTTNEAYAVNNNGLVAGMVQTQNGGSAAYVYDGATISYLQPFGGDSAAIYGMNDNGWFAGATSTAAGQFGPATAGVWHDGQVLALGGSTVHAWDVNNAGQVVGVSQVGNYNHPFFWENGTLSDLDWSFGVAGSTSQALAINESGHIVGASYFGGRVHAVMQVDGVATDLGFLLAGNTNAIALNNHDEVVGSTGYGPTDGTAYLWHEGIMTDLNTVTMNLPAGLRLIDARGVNDNDLIVGVSLSGFTRRAYLLTPMPQAPEPASLAVLGLAVVAYARRRRRV